MQSECAAGQNFDRCAGTEGGFETNFEFDHTYHISVSWATSFFAAPPTASYSRDQLHHIVAYSANGLSRAARKEKIQLIC